MKAGILGKKIGMTQVFTEDGRFVPVTAIEAGPCRVLKVLGNKVMLGFGERKEKNTPKPELGFYKNAKLKPNAFIKEVPFDTNKDIAVGKEIRVDIFKEKDFVDITGTSKGKGFQGGVRRWGWRGGPGSHGSMHHRRVGSIGASSFPSRINKGHKLPGRMGNEKNTVQSLEVIKVDKDKNMMLVKGPVPGANNGYLEIRFAKKKPVIRQEEAKKEEKNQNK